MSAPRPVPVASEEPAKTPSSEAQAPPEPSRARPGRRRRWLPAALILLAFLGLALWGGQYLHARLSFVHETDARVVADMVAVGARVEGWIAAIEVDEGQAVGPGERIARVDSRGASLDLDQTRAALESLHAERSQVNARRAMVDEQTKARLGTVRSQLSAAKALAESLEHQARLATTEFDRARKLSSRGVMSANALDRARTAYHRAKQELLSAKADVAAAQAKLGEMAAARHELAVLDAEAQVLDKRLAQFRARVERQALTVSEHDVLAPGPGVVTRLFVEAGEYLRLGQRVALMHDPENVWIEANVRETEIGRVRVGQTVTIVVDAYPDAPMRGRVARIGQATTGEFALLPTPNPSGNFTKVTQRLPVRVEVEGGDGRLRPGMLVEIDIDVGKRG